MMAWQYGVAAESRVDLYHHSPLSQEGKTSQRTSSPSSLNSDSNQICSSLLAQQSNDFLDVFGTIERFNSISTYISSYSLNLILQPIIFHIEIHFISANKSDIVLQFQNEYHLVQQFI